MKRLIVYLDNEPVGILDQDDGGRLGFSYTREWLKNPDAMPLSRSLPLQNEPFQGKHIRDFLDCLIFNILIGNADAHGKNYSMLYRKRERRLAPFYDLVCTLAWPELSKIPAMKIGLSDSMDDVTPAHWQKMAQECGLGWPMLRERIASLCHKTLAGLGDAEVRGAAHNDTTVDRITGIIAQRAASLLQRLA